MYTFIQASQSKQKKLNFFQKNLLFSLKFKVIQKVSGQSNVSDIIDF